ncbi:hypothetical protein MYCTH_2300087 [Thermothelomyces thermophilus ATCC 42464]|uniref:Uncharacterized protein n=1 Tax=Thermothelomyces thermophilus (strain ATCC 42464 / BCRC 31852 / DSM 1799) TaxID=573729 RepID=G2QAE6_THET4|nr:uncharacterized protein MYCTH_2300087 [Thermothelomyces thermophilus ATCC 42464]AEO55842.1 hypothetical protein MYCTH_2300087 [Thermothelomyces thermophilus ATCC 42464]
MTDQQGVTLWNRLSIEFLADLNFGVSVINIWVLVGEMAVAAGKDTSKCIPDH